MKNYNGFSRTNKDLQNKEKKSFDDKDINTENSTHKNQESKVTEQSLSDNINNIETITNHKLKTFIVVNCYQLRLRTKPYKDSEIIELLDSGCKIQEVPADKDVQGWTYVTFNENNGYVMNEFIEEVK